MAPNCSISEYSATADGPRSGSAILSSGTDPTIEPSSVREARLRRGMTPYDRWGDLPALVLAAVALGAGWLRQVRWSTT